MKHIIIALVVLAAVAASALEIPLPPGVQHCWAYTGVSVNSMDAKPVMEVDGTFSWELLNDLRLVDAASPTPWLPQPPALQGKLRVVHAELVAAGTAEGIDWGTAYGVFQAMVIQRALVTKLATLLEIPEPTKTAWVEAVLQSLRQ